MIRLIALCLAGCVVCAGLVLIEFGSARDLRTSFEARLLPAQTKPVRKLADPPFSPTQRLSEASSSADDADSSLRDVRLTGVVIGPDRRIAIFAVTGANPLLLSEGDTLKEWRLDSISAEKVLLSGPAGKLTLEPRADANLVRSPPLAVQPGQVEPGVPPGAASAAEPAQPMAVTPIRDAGAASTPPTYPAMGYSIRANPSQDYAAPYYSQPYPYSDPYAYYAYPYHYGGYAYGVPTAFNVGFGFFPHRAFFHPRFHPGFHPGFHGGGLRGGGFHGNGFHGGGVHGR